MAWIQLTVLLVNLIGCCFALSNLIDTLTAHNATTFVNLINTAGLTDTLQGDGPFTVVAPTDLAFTKIPAADLQKLNDDKQALIGVLKYHVILGEIFSWDLSAGQQIKTLNGHSLRIYVVSTKHYFNNALALVEEIQATNGVIYLINEVLEVPEGTIVGILKNPDYNLSTFAGLVHDRQRELTLNMTFSINRYTVFAPSNDAFAKLTQEMMDNIKTNAAFAKNLIDYHIHVGTLHVKSLTNDKIISTRYSRHNITITHDTASADIILNKHAHITLADIEADNGVVHIISEVLIPDPSAVIIG